MAEMSLEEKIQRVIDRNAVKILAQNLYHTDPGQDPWQTVLGRFDMKNPDVRVEMNWGVYDGAEGLVKLYPGLHDHMAKSSTTGMLIELMDFSPIIEVSGDGKTAKLLVDCLGYETWPDGGQLKGYWTIGKRGYDYVKVDGQWKFLHYHVYGVYFAPYDEGWITGADHIDYPGLEDFLPDRPPTTLNDTWYKPNRVYKDHPVPPAPYQTFDEKTAY